MYALGYCIGTVLGIGWLVVAIAVIYMVITSWFN